MSTKQKGVPGTKLSTQMTELWGQIPARYWITATTDYIVFIDQSMNVEWKSTTEWDKRQRKNRPRFATVLNHAAAIESAPRDGADEQKAFNLKRQIGEAIERGLAGDFRNAQAMLRTAEAYRVEMLTQRQNAIQEYSGIKDGWRNSFHTWTVTHYAIGGTALVISSLVASKPGWLGENLLAFFAWLVAALTGLLTFLSPDKKAAKFDRAWSVLNREITRYKTHETHTVDDVLEAYEQAEGIIRESPGAERKPRKNKKK
jgi:hypothetical protein